MLSEMNALLRELCLSNIRSAIETSLAEAEKHPQTHLEFCLGLFRHEVNCRRSRKAEKLLSASRLPLAKNMQNFDLTKLPLPLQRKIQARLQIVFALAKFSAVRGGCFGRHWIRETKP